MGQFQLYNSILERHISLEKGKVDAFIEEFSNFDLKHAKKELALISKKLIVFKKHAGRSLFSDDDSDRSKYEKVKSEYLALKDKITRYTALKDEIDILVRRHFEK